MSLPDSRRQLTILITGGAGGIGHTAAQRLAALGHTVYAADLTCDTHEPEAPGIVTTPLDVTSQESIRRLHDRLMAETNGEGPDVLINCAGYSMPGPIELIPLPEWRQLFEVNLFGLIAVTQAFLPSLKSRPSNRARVVNIGSLIGRLPHPMSAPYCASKHALVAVNEAMRCELAQFGIRVIFIEPGPIRTAFFERMQQNLQAVRRTTSDHAAAADSYEDPLKAAEDVFEYYCTRAPGPDVVADCIVHVVRASRPKAHYMIPRRNTLRLWGYRLMPTRLTDRIVRRLFRLDGKRTSRFIS